MTRNLSFKGGREIKRSDISVILGECRKSCLSGIKKINRKKPQQFLGDIIVKCVRNHVPDVGWHDVWIQDNMDLRFQSKWENSLTQLSLSLRRKIRACIMETCSVQQECVWHRIIPLLMATWGRHLRRHSCPYPRRGAWQRACEPRRGS